MNLRRSLRAHQRDVDIADKPASQRTSIARARFMANVEFVGVETRRCQHTLPLFPLWLILDADQTLASDMRGIVERTHP